MANDGTVASTSAKSAQPSSLAELKALSKIIKNSINLIEATITARGMEFPSMHTPMTLESEAVRMQPEVDSACGLIVSAAYQLINYVRSPMLTVMAIGTQYAMSAALGVAVTANVPEVLREAGPKGTHVNVIARASTIDPAKLGRILRVLATNHIFTEVSPDVFANNRISSTLDTGKSIQEILPHPEVSKHVGTIGVAAGIGHLSDEVMKAAAYLQETLFDPKLSHSQEVDECALSVAVGKKISMWDWFELPGNELRHQRFNVAMDGVKMATAPTAVLEGFDWKGLKKDALVVDVGGGIGSQSLTIAQHCPHLRFIIQDREPVIQDAVQFWGEQMPGALTSQKVILQAHDFFTPQPVKNASVFLLRNIMHDWSDKYCTQILRHLRASATPETRLVIVDSLLSYACEEDDSLKGIPGAERKIPPKPLLPNMGHIATTSYHLDLQMAELMNGQERTAKQMKELMDLTGWKLVQVYHSIAFSTAKVVGMPA